MKRKLATWLTLGFGVFLLLVLSAPILIGVAHERAGLRRSQTLNDLRLLTLAAQIYAGDSGGILPDSNRWCDQLVLVLGTNKEPSLYPYELDRYLSRKQQGYAINSLTAGRNIDALESNAVLFLPVRQKGRNLSVALQDADALAWDARGMLEVVDQSQAVHRLEGPGHTRE